MAEKVPEAFSRSPLCPISSVGFLGRAVDEDGEVLCDFRGGLFSTLRYYDGWRVETDK